MAAYLETLAPQHVSLREAFLDSATTHPDRVAVTAQDGSLTYAELRTRSEQLAAELAAMEVGPDSAVPLLLETGIDLVVGLVGTVLSGAGYLPVDPDAPRERIRRLVKESNSPVVVASTRTSGLVPEVTAVQVDAPEPVEAPAAAPEVLGSHLAYVIHTSGSTGAPKGVEVEQHSVMWLFEATRPWFGFTEQDVFSVFHSVAFDFSVWELWGALLHGARAVLVPYDTARDPGRFRDLVRSEGVTILNQTPSAFRGFLGAGPTPASLRVVVLGGERLDVSLLRGWFDEHGDGGPRVVNMYGITETTVHASYRVITPADLTRPTVSPIGEPLPDLRFVLDGDEPLITGPGVARGYLNRPDLTAERFTEVDGERAYRTGDRIERLPGGGYAYLGRVDGQLSVRGHRVEPAEVEAVLDEHPEVEGSLVAAVRHREGDVRLVASVLVPPEARSDRLWWERLRSEIVGRVTEALPRHLRPSAYFPVEALPLTRNGKLDRSGAAGAAPTNGFTPAQAEVAAIWRQVLDIPEVGLEQDFFDLGGTSLTLVRMLGVLGERFSTELDLAALLDGVTVATLAAQVDSADPETKG